MKAWNAYLDLGEDKVRVSPRLYSQILLFISSNSILSDKQKKVAFNQVEKDIQFTISNIRSLGNHVYSNWEYTCIQSKLYQHAFSTNGVEKSISDLKDYLLKADTLNDVQLQDIIVPMIFIRYSQNGIEDTVKWMEELLEQEWETPTGPIKIPWSFRVCKFIYIKMDRQGLLMERFLRQCSDFGIHFDNTLIRVKMLLKNDNVDAAIEIAKGFPDGDVSADGINELIGNHILCRWVSNIKSMNSGLAKSQKNLQSRAEIWEKGNSFLKKVKVKSTLSYNAILVFHLKNREYGLVYQKFNGFLQSGLTPDIKTLTVVIQALFMLNKIREVDEMLDGYTKSICKVDSMFIQTVVTGYVRAKFQEKANYYYNYFIQQGFVPSEKLYASLICNYCHLGDLGTASQLYKEYLDRGFQPSQYILVAFVKGYSVNRDYESALSVFNSMESAGIVPTVYSFNSLIKIFIQAGKKHEVLNLLQQMKRQGVEKNQITSFLMINFYSKFGNEEELLYACKDHQLNGFEIDEHCLLRLVEFYCRKNNFTRALDYAHRISHLDVVERPSYAHNVILKSLWGNTINPISVIEYMNELLRTDIPDCKTFEIFINCLTESCRFELMDSVIENEVLRRVKPDQSLIQAIIFGYLKSGNKKKCLEWYEYLGKNGMIPSANISKTMKFVEKMSFYETRAKDLYRLYRALKSLNGYSRSIASKARRSVVIRDYKNAIQKESDHSKARQYLAAIRRLQGRGAVLESRRFRRRMIIRGKNSTATLSKNRVAALQVSKKLPIILDSYSQYQVPFSAIIPAVNSSGTTKAS